MHVCWCEISRNETFPTDCAYVYYARRCRGGLRLCLLCTQMQGWVTVVSVEARSARKICVLSKLHLWAFIYAYVPSWVLCMHEYAGVGDQNVISKVWGRYVCICAHIRTRGFIAFTSECICMYLYCTYRCVCVCVYIHTHPYYSICTVWICKYIHTRPFYSSLKNMYSLRPWHIYTHTHTYVYMSVPIYTWYIQIHTYVQARTQEHTSTQAHTRLQTHTHTHTHTQG
jgi:hypothetical protein